MASERAPSMTAPALGGIWLASALVLAVSLLTAFRLGLGDDVATALTANGARVGLAAAAGGALALAGALRRAHGRERPLFELSLLGVAAGASAGGLVGARVLEAAPLAGFGAGAAAGAALAVALVRATDRPSRLANLGAGALLAGFVAAAALAGSYARERLDAVAPIIAWLLGDLSGASGIAVGLALLVTLSGVGAAWVWLGQGEAGRARLDTLAVLAFGFGIGLAGLLAFVGSFVPRTVRALAPGASGRTIALTSSIAGAASVAAIDAVPRWLVGGYTLPFDVAAGMLALPIFLLWNRTRLRRALGSMHPLLETLELVVIGAATVVATALAGFLTLVIQKST